MESKVTVIAKEGTALIGSHFHVLEDETKAELKTSDIESFLSYVKSKAGIIFYDYSSIQAFESLSKLQKSTKPLASCRLMQSAILSALIAVNGKKQSLEEFEMFLLAFRPWMDSKGMDVLSNLRDFRVSKIVDVERQKNNKGDYKFSVSRQASGKTSFEPPEAIGFTVPVFEHLDDIITTSMEFVFDYSEILDDEKKPTGVALSFMVRDMQFNESIKERSKEIVKKVISELTAEKYWGSLEIHEMTDSWRYKENPAR